MAEFPALTLWTDAYLSDTRHLSTVEHGAYLLLLMEAWRRPHCDLPDDDKILSRLAGLSGDEWVEIKDVVMAFWKRDGRSKTWSQKRLSLERDKARVRSRSQSNKAAKRWNSAKKDDATALPKECPVDASTATATATVVEEEGKPSPSIARADDELGLGDVLQPGSVKPKRATKAKRQVGVDVPIPENFEPSLGAEARRIVDGWPPGMLDREIFSFRSHAVANGRLAKNWDAAFGTWLSKAEERRVGSGNRGTQTFSGSAGYSGRAQQSRPATGFLRRALEAEPSGDSGEVDRRDDHTSGGIGELPYIPSGPLL